MEEVAVQIPVYHLGSESGSTFAFFFFAAITGFIGFAIYRVIYAGLTRFFEADPRLRAHRFSAASFGLTAFLGLFSMIYTSSLDGFYHAEPRGDELVLHYILPKRTVVLHRDDIGELTRGPTFKSQWRLRIYSTTGVEYESANAGYRPVKEAWHGLDHWTRAQNYLSSH
ncbi:MAG: hypothetical protein ACYTG7_16830 [Planctomycetota bacterium]|jgi:hypothetical protein